MPIEPIEVRHVLVTPDNKVVEGNPLSLALMSRGEMNDSRLAMAIQTPQGWFEIEPRQDHESLN